MWKDKILNIIINITKVMGWRSRWFTTKDKGSLTHLSSTIAAITYATRALSRTKLPPRTPSPSVLSLVRKRRGMQVEVQEGVNAS